MSRLYAGAMATLTPVLSIATIVCITNAFVYPLEVAQVWGEIESLDRHPVGA